MKLNKLLNHVKEYLSKDEDQGPSSGSYKYEDPKTGEIFTFKRRGVYKKNGRILVPTRGTKSRKDKTSDN